MLAVPASTGFMSASSPTRGGRAAPCGCLRFLRGEMGVTTPLRTILRCLDTTSSPKSTVRRAAALPHSSRAPAACTRRADPGDNQRSLQSYAQVPESGRRHRHSLVEASLDRVSTHPEAERAGAIEPLRAPRRHRSRQPRLDLIPRLDPLGDSDNRASARRRRNDTSERSEDAYECSMSVRTFIDVPMMRP